MSFKTSLITSKSDVKSLEVFFLRLNILHLYFKASFIIFLESVDNNFSSKKLQLSMNLDVCPIKLMFLIFFKFLNFIPLLPPLGGRLTQVFSYLKTSIF